jgi:MFS family permease
MLRPVTDLVPESGPQRRLALATFVNAVGTGAFINTSALFFTRAVGLPTAQVGIGLTVAGAIGLAAGVPAGHVADRWGPRRTWLIALCAEALAMGAYVFVRTFWPFLVLACVNALATAASRAAAAPVDRRLAGADLSVLLGRLRAIVNLASSLGLVVAAVSVQLDTRTAYLVLVLVNAVSFAGAGVVVATLPPVPPLPAPPERRRWIALRDPPYVTITALDAVLSLQFPVLTFALPLWVVDHTSAPRWVVPVDALINTVLCAVLQVRVSRAVRTPAEGARTARQASLVLLAAFMLVAVAAGLPWWAAMFVLMAAMVVQTIGEIQTAAAGYALSFGLAPPHAQGQYSGLFGMGTGMASAAGPVLLGALCLSWGRPGWLVLGMLMVVAGVLNPVVVKRARTPEVANIGQLS